MCKPRIAFLLTAGAVLAGCATPPTVSYLNRPDCVGAQHRITVTANPQNLRVQPPNLCVENQETVTVQVVGPGVGDVSVRGKPGAAWIRGTNSTNPNQFTFVVPDANDAPAGTYFYNIIIEGYGIIDPMLTIDE